MAPALCVVILIGVDQGTADAREAAGVHLIASSTAGEFAPPPPPPSAPAPTGSSSVDEPAEDVVTVPLGQQYVWPSGIGLAVPAPTIQAATARHPAAAVLIRTTVLNTSTAPYDVRAVLDGALRRTGCRPDRRLAVHGDDAPASPDAGAAVGLRDDLSGWGRPPDPGVPGRVLVRGRGVRRPCHTLRFPFLILLRWRRERVCAHVGRRSSDRSLCCWVCAWWRSAVDSTILDDAVATQDTVT
jgi:hypothetical protein